MSDDSQILDLIGRCVTGFNRGDRHALLEAFDPRGVQAGFHDGDLQWDSAEDFATFCAETAPDPEGPVPDWTVESLTIADQTAVAVVHDRWGRRSFRDTLAFLKIAGRWRIVFKTFHGLA